MLAFAARVAAKGLSQNNPVDSAASAHRPQRYSAVKYRRILLSRTLLAARSRVLGLDLVISRQSLTSQLGHDYGIILQKGLLQCSFPRHWSAAIRSLND
ncbi:MAG: hypothetical protein ACI9DC_004923 [Gammaproteobacteria bacterium]